MATALFMSKLGKRPEVMLIYLLCCPGNDYLHWCIQKEMTRKWLVLPSCSAMYRFLCPGRCEWTVTPLTCVTNIILIYAPVDY